MSALQGCAAAWHSPPTPTNAAVKDKSRAILLLPLWLVLRWS